MDKYANAGRFTNVGMNAPQVTAGSIRTLLYRAYAGYTPEPGAHVPLKQWCLMQNRAEFAG